jgi:hydrogenase maturation protein HypF
MTTTIKFPGGMERKILALGGDLKCRPAWAWAGEIGVFDEIGDLAGPESQEALEDLVADQAPEVLVCDRHPGYFSADLARRVAAERGIELRTVQHHRAHVAAVGLELGLWQETVVGLAFDGTGYGDDGLSWGGEFFVGSIERGFERRAHFAPLPIPGGDAAVREPWRIALALLIERGADDGLIRGWIERHHVPVADLALFRKGLRGGLAIGRSTALGRWFDAASALLGIGVTAAFEAEAAIRMQRLAEGRFGQGAPADWPVEVRPGEPMVIDFPDLAASADGREDAPARAAAFHLAVARAVADVAGQLAAHAGTDLIVASGGCFLNGLFDRQLGELLAARNLRYLKPVLLPPGDQALAVGQIGMIIGNGG